MFSKFKNILLTIIVGFFSLMHVGYSQNWTQITTTGSSPTTRDFHSAVYDNANNMMIVFAGQAGSPGYQLLNDLWVLSTANGLGGASGWTKLSPTGSIPTTMNSHTAVYDNTNNRMIIFGGLGAGVVVNNKVFVLSNANGEGGTPNWIQLAPAGSAPTTRCYHSAVYDAANNRMIVFGGWSNGLNLNDVWVLSTANGLSGLSGWSQLVPTGDAPIARFNHSAVYDTTDNMMIIYGGFADGHGSLSDVWVMSHANGLDGTPSWTQITTTGDNPGARYSHTAIYDHSKNQMIIFAGAYGGYANDVWVLNHANGLGGTPFWTQITATGSNPTTRFAHSAVYDEVNSRMIIYAGKNANYPNDIWVLSPATVPVKDWMNYSGFNSR